MYLGLWYTTHEVISMSKHYEQRKEANKRYLSKIDEIRIRMPKESNLKKKIENYTKSTGESINSFVLRAIRQVMEQDE